MIPPVNKFYLLAPFLILLASCQVASRSTSPVLTEEEAPRPVLQESASPAEASVRAANTSRQRRPDTGVGSIRNPQDEESGLIGEVAEYANVWDRIRAGFSLQDHYSHPDVIEEIRLYSSNPEFFEHIALRATPFLFWIVEEIERRDMPLELALVPIVESAFDPKAYSSEHAVGLWQIMGPTANNLGIERDWWYDGRRDPLASTNAALDYLQALYEQFDADWLLALAAYNAGEGNVRRAIRRDRDADNAEFWTLSLPKETRSHVPRILAVANIIQNPDLHGITLPEISNSHHIDIVEIDFQIDLAIAAQLAAMDAAELRQLNPGYLQWSTHPDSTSALVLPYGKADFFRSQVAEFPADRRLVWDRYEIKPGDTLGSIALKMGTRVDVLQKLNGLGGSRIIAGDSLLIPRNGDSNLLAPITINHPISPDPAPTSYRVRKGDNLWSIARRFDQRSADIASWNGIAIDTVLQPGQILVLQAAEYVASVSESESQEQIPKQQTVYRINKGDSLALIAGKFGVAIDEIIAWNQLNRNAYIYPGQEIVIFTGNKKFN